MMLALGIQRTLENGMRDDANCDKVSTWGVS